VYLRACGEERDAASESTKSPTTSSDSGAEVAAHSEDVVFSVENSSNTLSAK